MNVSVKQINQNQWQLWVTHPYMGFSNPAGPRLLRLNPPLVKFLHDNPDQAWRDAKKLQEHINSSPSLRNKRTAD